MKFVRERIPLAGAFTSGGVSNIAIGYTDYWVLGFELDYQLPKTDQTSPVFGQDPMYRAITGMQLVAGGDPYLSVTAPDARSLYHAIRNRNGGEFRAPAGAAGAVTMGHTLPVMFGVHPRNPDGSVNFRDSSAGIKPDSGLTLTVNWGASSALGANMTIGAATLGITLIGGIPESPADVPLYRPIWYTSQHAPKQGLGLGDADPLSIGRVYRRSHLQFLLGAAGSDVRTDGLGGTACSEFAITLENGRKILFDKTWVLSRATQAGSRVADDNSGVSGVSSPTYAQPTALAHHNPGSIMVDWYQLLATSGLGAASHYGLDLRGAQPNAVKFGYSVDVATNLNIAYFHEAYLPW